MSGRDAAYASGRSDGGGLAATYRASGGSMSAPDALGHLSAERALRDAHDDGSLAAKLGLTAVECADRGDGYRDALTAYIAGWDDAIWSATVEEARAAGLVNDGGTR